MVHLVININLLLTMSILIGLYPFKLNNWWDRHKMVRGVIIGLLGVLIMSFPFIYTEGIIFDTRTILLTVSGMVFGLVPTLVAAIMMIIFRIMMGGAGVVMGISTILVSSTIGIGWHLWRFEAVDDVKPPLLEFLVVGFISQFFSWLCMFLLPRSEWEAVLKMITIYFLVIYPFFMAALGIVLLSQIQRITAMREIARNEFILKTIFDDAPIGMSRTDLKTGKVLQINDAYARFLGYDKEEIIGHTWKEFTLPEEQGESDKADFLLVSGARDLVNLDKRYRTKDGRIVSANLTVSNLSIGEGVQELLGMIIDISEQKEYEEKLLHLSTHDPLTNLFNRNHFEQRIEEFVVPKDQVVAVLLAEVNGLKILNEAFGQNEGNRLLKKVAKILQASTSENDYLARIGGDDFAVVLTGRNREDYQAVAEDVTKKLSSIRMPGGMDMSVSVAFSVVDEEERTLEKAFDEAEKSLQTRKIYEEAPIMENLVQTVMTALHVRNKREEHHSRRVSFLSEQLGRAAGLSESEVGQLRLAGLFHDIGKIAISEEILNKHGELTQEEFSEIQRHVEIGYRLLSSVEDMGPIAHVVLAHHEWINGTGYPRGLKGEAIPLQARIVSIADAYDAMTSSRTYKQQYSSQYAARELKACSGTQFDTDLAKRFIEDVLFLPYDEL